MAAKAQGAWVETTDGQRILDFTSGQISSTLGHNHPRIVAAIERSLKAIIHLNSWMVNEDVLELARRLAELVPAPLMRSMLLNVGSETNEVAFRLAKAYTGGFEIVALTRAYHGLLAGTASVTYTVGHKGYGPLMPGAYAIPAPYEYRCPIRHCDNACDTLCLDVGFETVDQASVGQLAAMIAEPVLSTGGIIALPDGYLTKAKQKCEERGMLLIVDEAQTGFGRTGDMFAFERHGIVPDILTVSKTLGGGVPLGATITSAGIEDQAHANGFFHLTTHVSDPMPAAAGLAVLDVIAEEDLVARVRKMSDYLFVGLRKLQGRHEEIGDIRGRGLLVGIELVKDRDTKELASAMGTAVTAECLRLGLSMNIVKGDGSTSNCLRMAPPLSVTTDEIDLAISILDQAIRTARETTANDRDPTSG